jgi:hypothetical protein
VIVAHHGGELPALVNVLGGGVGAFSVGLLLARERLADFMRRWRRG